MRYIILISVIFMAFTLFAETYTVKQDGTGDFETIQEAVSSPIVVNGDTIIVYPGTYYENVYIVKDITVASLYYITGDEQYIHQTIISGQNDNVVTINSNGETELNGFTVVNGIDGIHAHQPCTPDTTKILNCIIRQNSEIGIYYVNGNSGCLYVDNCHISETNNGLAIFGFCNSLIENSYIDEIQDYGIFLYGTDPMSSTTRLRVTSEINNCEIYNNVNEAIHLDFATANVNNSILRDNNIAFKEVYYPGIPSYVNIENTTITENTTVFSDFINNVLSVKNSIIWNNTILGIPNLSDITYSDIQDGFNGTGNIDEDPLFFNTAGNDYTLSWTETEKSPCIDTGDPDPQYNDPDGTRADMGAYYYPHEIITYQFPSLATNNGWKWLCFDVLDKRIAFIIAQVMLDPMKAPEIFDKALYNKIEVPSNDIFEINYFEYPPPAGHWQNGDHPFSSPQGYKFHTFLAYNLEISGCRCEPETAFNLIAYVSPEEPKENWIGYYLSRSQHVYDAFYGYLDNIYSIQTQFWSVRRNPGGAWPDVSYTLDPGDLVIVKCEQDIENFCWIRQSPIDEFEIEEPGNFSYEEQADYTPIYMNLNPEDLPTEIGAIVDGECKGATVVQDTSAQICAYILESQGGSLEFEFYYGGRAQNKVIKEYYVYDPETMQTEMTSIKLGDKKDCYYVSFKDEPASKPEPVKLEASNYPNPFNPSGAGRSPVTTISYSLPNESEILLTIYNIKGQKVKELIKGTQPAGSYNVSWDGKDEYGKDVTSGIYFYKLKTQQNEIIRKMLLLK